MNENEEQDDRSLCNRFIEKALQLSMNAGFSQTNFAALIGVHPSRLSEWKKGVGKPSIEHAFKISKLLKISLDYLMDDNLKSPSAISHLTRNEELILQVYRQFDLSAADAIRGLASVAQEVAAKKGADDSQEKKVTTNVTSSNFAQNHDNIEMNPNEPVDKNGNLLTGEAYDDWLIARNRRLVHEAEGKRRRGKRPSGPE